MMGSGVLPGGEKTHRLETARVAGIQNGHAIAEHVTDIEMVAVGHDLDAVRTPANVAVGNMLDPVTNPLRRYRRVLGMGRTRHPGERRHAQQAP
jgi:hypothetical protein